MKEKLSDTMNEVIAVMKEHDGKLVRWNGGFWTYEGCKTKYQELVEQIGEDKIQENYRKLKGYYKENVEAMKGIPIWSCGVRTLQGLEKRGYVKLEKPTEYTYLEAYLTEKGQEWQ